MKTIIFIFSLVFLFSCQKTITNPSDKKTVNIGYSPNANPSINNYYGYSILAPSDTIRSKK